MHDFSKYKKIRIPINNQIHTLNVANDQKTRQEGLSNVDHLGFREGMIFIYDNPVHYSFTMEATKIPLQIIFISENFEVIQQFSCKEKQKGEITPWEPYKYVIEVA